MTTVVESSDRSVAIKRSAQLPVPIGVYQRLPWWCSARVSTAYPLTAGFVGSGLFSIELDEPVFLSSAGRHDKQHGRLRKRRAKTEWVRMAIVAYRKHKHPENPFPAERLVASKLLRTVNEWLAKQPGYLDRFPPKKRAINQRMIQRELVELYRLKAEGRL
jgi:hypothetical protein